VPGLGLDFVFPGLPEGGSTNNAYLRTLSLKEGETVLDLGAYAGLTAYLFASAVGPTGRVIAVEPDPETYRVLSGNLERVRSKAVGWIEPVQAAIWSERGTVKFCSEGNMGATTSSHARRGHEPVDVEAKTLQQLAEEYGLDRVDAVKMDVEGAEYDVIPAAGEFVCRFRPRFIIEVHKDEFGVIDTAAIEKAFSGFGYSCRFVTQSMAEAFPLLFACPLARETE
jgi:FkbM family methyltransferase